MTDEGRNDVTDDLIPILTDLLHDARSLVRDPVLAEQISDAGADADLDQLMELVRRTRYHVSRGDMEGHLLARFDQVLLPT